MTEMNPRTVARWERAGWDTGTHRTAAELLQPGQTVLILGGVRVVVLSVEPYVQVDSFVPDSRWVTLRYRWAMDTQGETLAGKWSLPASQRLRVG
jgi:hypothetical protein